MFGCAQKTKLKTSEKSANKYVQTINTWIEGHIKSVWSSAIIERELQYNFIAVQVVCYYYNFKCRYTQLQFVGSSHIKNGIFTLKQILFYFSNSVTTSYKYIARLELFPVSHETCKEGSSSSAYRPAIMTQPNATKTNLRIKNGEVRSI